MPFQLLKGFTGTFNFQVAREACKYRRWAPPAEAAHLPLTMSEFKFASLAGAHPFPQSPESTPPTASTPLSLCSLSSPFPSPGRMVLQSLSFCSSWSLVAKTWRGRVEYKRMGGGESSKCVWGERKKDWMWKDGNTWTKPRDPASGTGVSG